MPVDTLKTITQAGKGVLTEKGSRFFSFSFPVSDMHEITGKRKAVREEHPYATHHCFAWRVNPFHPEEFAQDDGEPGGTAGVPILGVIKSEELINVLIIVVRYFGGTKLGKAGLIQSYRESALRSVQHSGKKTLGLYSGFRIEYPYDQENRIREMMNRFNMKKQDELYLETVTITVRCPFEHTDDLQSMLEHHSYLGIEFERKEDRYLPVT